VTRRRVRLGAMVAMAVALVLFLTTVEALRWVALILVLACIPVLVWTLFNPERRDA
jgi:multisubunit Na+/H+ antiporter MnhE subunit